MFRVPLQRSIEVEDKLRVEKVKKEWLKMTQTFEIIYAFQHTPQKRVNFTNILQVAFCCTEVFFTAFLNLLLVLVIFGQKDIGAKVTLQFLVKLTKGWKKSLG